MTAKDIENKTLLVIILTLITMVAEVVVGLMTHSMALTADGWHMGTHALALSITFFAYYLTRKLSNSDLFVFSTGKFGTLAGFSSSILLGLTGIWIIFESFERFIHPLSIQFGEAIIVAVIGLIVNVVSIMIMEDGHSQCHSHDKDYNFKAAYLHILADAMTSVFAIVALIAGKFFGFVFLDSIVGLLGGVLICVWAYNLIKSTGAVLLDCEKKTVKEQIRELLCNMGLNAQSLHVWQTSDDKVSVIAKITSTGALDTDELKNQIRCIHPCDTIVIEQDII